MALPEFGDPLSPSEEEVLAFLLAGESHKTIAKRRNRSQSTIDVQVASILIKTGHANRYKLMAAEIKRLQRGESS